MGIRSTTVSRLMLALIAAVCMAAMVGPFAGVVDASVAPRTQDAPSDAPAPDGPQVVATLVVDGQPLEGIAMIVRQDGAEIGRAVSDVDGFVQVPVPAAGRYQVTLDPATFPPGVGLAEGVPAEVTPTVRGTGNRTVVFRLAPSAATTPGTGTPGTDTTTPSGSGDREPAVVSPTVPSGGASTVERLASLIASGVRFGLVIALAAVGLSLIFGTTGLTNFAHGELLTFGAMVAWYLNSNNGGLGIPLLLAAVGAVIATTAFGAGFELGIYRPLRRRGMPIVSQMVVSIGLAFGLRYLFSVFFGSSNKQYAQYAAQAPTLHLGPISMRPKDVVISLIAIVALVAVGLFLQRARLGTAIRAVSDNRDLSIASGIDDKRVILLVWCMAGAMGGVAGIMLGSSEAVGYTMGQRVLLVMFAAVLLGGLGTTFGAMFGGLFVGIVSDLSTFWLDADLKIVVALATLVAVLLVRPQGVFGVKARTA